MKIYQVDSFTNQPFKGNPAGVCLVKGFPNETYMQSIALEMNLSETAFVDISNETYNIRFFTPLTEVDICGHATLASAHIIYEKGIVGVENEIVLKAKKSVLKVSKKNDWLAMDFPVFPIQKINIPADLGEILGVTPVETYRSENGWTIVLVASENEVVKANPNFDQISKKNLGLMTIVTATSDRPEFDIVVRVFCDPKSGINEDPVTGSANCILAPFWNLKTGKTRFSSQQVSARTGNLKLELINNRVIIEGQARTVFEIETIDL